MALANDAASIFQYMEHGITHRLKEEAIQRVTDELVDDFREKAEEEVKKAFEGVTLGRVGVFKDMMSLRDELHVYIHHQEKEGE